MKSYSKDVWHKVLAHSWIIIAVAIFTILAYMSAITYGQCLFYTEPEEGHEKFISDNIQDTVFMMTDWINEKRKDPSFRIVDIEKYQRRFANNPYVIEIEYYCADTNEDYILLRGY